MAPQPASSSLSSAFFYGTLMHPAILQRVIGNGGEHLTLCPAILPDYTRHGVKDEDYPAIIPYTHPHLLLPDDLSEDDRCVRGMLVIGLKPEDVTLLDGFEGDEYVRKRVSVTPLAQSVPLSSPPPVSANSPPLPPLEERFPPISAQTYVWAHPITRLHPTLWNYEDFVRDNAWKWVEVRERGDGVERTEREMYYDEVDRRRGMEGRIVNSGAV